MTALRRYRMKVGISQKQAAKELGISLVHMNRLEQDRVPPSFALALVISKWLGVRPDYLWELTESGIRAITR